ncbi:MAG: peptide ABC transporter substrate-binding protein [bacterium]|nr:peptide ABC transporter substrate-binding protein [bacterium]
MKSVPFYNGSTRTLSTLTIAAAVCAALLLSACTKAPVQEESSGEEFAYNPADDPLVNPPEMYQAAPDDRSQVDTDGTLYLNLDGNPQNLNPIFASSMYEYMVNDLTFEGPFQFDAKMDWTLNKAWVDSYEESEDHLSAILKLKPGLTWQDGEPLNAHDIAYSWKTILDDRVPCPAVKTGTDDIKECVALDDLTVKFVHKEAVPTAKWNVFFPIIPKHLYEVHQDEEPSLQQGDYYSELNRNPVGSGSYKIKEWIANDRIVLERWEDYPGPKPYFKRVVFRLIPDHNAQLLSFEKGDLDCTLLSGEQFAKQTSGDQFASIGRKLLQPEWSYYYIGWNMDGGNPFFNDKRVRVAMTHAMNINLILDKVLYNLYEQCRGIYHPDAWMYNPNVELLKYDPAKADELLNEAGWEKDETDGWRYKDVDGKRVKFEFTMLLPQGSQTAPQIANYFQQDLRAIGVDMKTRTVEWATFMQMTRKHEFQAHMAGWGTGTDPDTGWNLWRTEEYEDGRNYGGYSNPRVDELFELGRHEFDPDKRKAYYQEIHKLVYDDQPYLFLYNRSSTYAINKRIRGIQYGPRGIFNFSPSDQAWWTPVSPQAAAVKP